MSTPIEINTRRDFEVIWVDRFTNEFKDLDDVTCEIYHFEEAKPAKITAVNREPYLITDGINDRVNVGSYNPSASDWIDVDFQLQLNIITTQLSDLGCQPNDFVVPYTNEKYSIQNTRAVFALSACELAALINLNASGYIATSENGYLVLNSIYIGSESILEMGNGTINQVLGLLEGYTTYGSNVLMVNDLLPSPAIHINTGRYIWTELILDTKYLVNERYYVLFKGMEPNTLLPENHEEDFTPILPRPYGLIAEFLK